jgi:hypothetical protein
MALGTVAAGQPEVARAPSRPASCLAHTISLPSSAPALQMTLRKDSPAVKLLAVWNNVRKGRREGHWRWVQRVPAGAVERSLVGLAVLLRPFGGCRWARRRAAALPTRELSGTSHVNRPRLVCCRLLLQCTCNRCGPFRHRSLESACSSTSSYGAAVQFWLLMKPQTAACKELWAAAESSFDACCSSL